MVFRNHSSSSGPRRAGSVVVAFCATASAATVLAQPVPCNPGSQPLLTETFEFCVIKSSNARDTIMPNAQQGQCPIPGSTNPVRKWVKIPVMREATRPFNPVTPYQVDKAIIVVHGDGENPTGLFNTITGNRDSASQAWVVGPQFLNYGQQPGAQVLQWECATADTGGRNIGDASVYPTDVQVSSFDVLDQLVRKMKAQSTAQEIIVIGHSGGGQLVSRYAMATKVEAEVNIPVRYIIASPGPYAYLSNKRYTYHTSGQTFREKTSFSAACNQPTDTQLYYDKYPFGLYGVDTRTPSDHYVNGPQQDLIDNLENKPRLYIIGENDTAQGDASCAAMQQESNRVKRSRTFWHHLSAEVAAANNAHFCVVPGVGHSGADVIGSVAATKYWKEGNVTGAPRCEDGPVTLSQ